MILNLLLVSIFVRDTAAEVADAGLSTEFIALVGLILTAAGTIYATNRSSASANKGSAVSQVPMLWERNDSLEKETRIYEATLLLHEADRAARGLPPIPRPEAIQ